MSKINDLFLNSKQQFFILTLLIIVDTVLIVLTSCTINVYHYRDYKVAYDIQNTVVKDITQGQEEFNKKFNEILDTTSKLLTIGISEKMAKSTNTLKLPSKITTNTTTTPTTTQTVKQPNSPSFLQLKEFNVDE